MTGWLHLLSRTIAGAMLAVLALGLWGVSLASATDTASDAGDEAAIDNALPENGAVRLLVSVPGDAEIDVGGVEVTMNGESVEADAVSASRGNVQRTSILAIDTSDSMRGPRIAEAKKAAIAYLAAVPANVRVGVLTFDDTVDLVVPPGLDRDAARSVVSELQLTRDTSLYDGVLGALEAAGRVARRPASARSWCSRTARTPRPLP